MKLILNEKNEQYCEYLKQQIGEKERLQTKYNSIYEFRVLEGFDGFYQNELRAMLQYIKENKVCQTTDDHKFRESDCIIVQKLDKMAILKSSAIMIDSLSIDCIKHFCLSAQMSFLVLDSRMMNAYKSGSRQELIQRLNSVDLVIMDEKESSKITAFLNNSFQLISLDDELQGLQKLLKIVGDQSYKKEDISHQFDEIRESLYYLIERNKDPFLYTSSVNRYFYVCPQGMKVSGLAFQRFILVPGLKGLQKPIFSKCSWIFQSLKDGQYKNILTQAPFLKKLESQGLYYNYRYISIAGSKFLFDQLSHKTEIQFQYKEYHPKVTLLELKYKHKTALNYFLDSNLFLVLPFELIQVKGEYQQDHFQFEDVQKELEGPINKIKKLLLSQGKLINTNLGNIIQSNLNHPCIVCFNDNQMSRFVFGCCGTNVSTNCLIKSIKNSGIIKCPSCRFEVTDDNLCIGFFLSADPDFQNYPQYYKDFNQCYNQNKDPLLDSFVYGAGMRMESSQVFGKTDTCQIFICIDYVCPNISHLIIDHQSTQDYIQYHIQRIIHQQIGKSSYKYAQVLVYSSNTSVFNYLTSINQH